MNCHSIENIYTTSSVIFSCSVAFAALAPMAIYHVKSKQTQSLTLNNIRNNYLKMRILLVFLTTAVLLSSVTLFFYVFDERYSFLVYCILVIICLLSLSMLLLGLILFIYTLLKVINE